MNRKLIVVSVGVALGVFVLGPRVLPKRPHLVTKSTLLCPTIIPIPFVEDEDTKIELNQYGTLATITSTQKNQSLTIPMSQCVLIRTKDEIAQ